MTPGTVLPGANAGLLPVTTPDVPQGATVLRVGADEAYPTLSSALSAAQDGDVILVDAGTYTNDFATVRANVTIEGVGGMANFVATEPPSNLKGILTVDDDVTIKNLSFSGAAIDAADGGNAAGIRYEGGNMTLVNDQFSSNQNGILAAPVLPQLTSNTITIDHSVFSDNGSGTGFTHNLYIGAVSSLNVTNSVFEGAIVGHEFKSRAEVNTITGNVFSDGPTGTASYSIDLPDGGRDTVTDNYIEKGPDAENDASVHFGGEGIPYAGSSLTLTGNDFVNDLGGQAVAVLNQTALSVTVTGNTFDKYSASQIASGPANETNNVDASGNPLQNSAQVGVLPGSTDVITDSAAHAVMLDGTTQAVEGGAGALTVYAQAGHVIAIGGTGGLTFSEGPDSGGNSISTVAGSSNTLTVNGQDLIDSEGTDTITTGNGNVTGQINGTATISDGAASNQWAVNGTATITGNGGTPSVSVGATGNATITGPLSYLSLGTDGGNATVDITEGGVEDALKSVGGAITAQFSNGSMSITTASGSSGTDLTLGAGTAQVMSAGADTIHAGSGADTVIVSGKANIYAGSGSLSVYGRSDQFGANIYGNGGTYLISGDSGNLTYYGGALDSTVQLQLANNTLIGGTGHMTVDGGSREVITGGAGGVTYNATDGGGGNTITTAAGSSNTLRLGAADTIQSWGSDTINGGTGNQSLTINGNSTITGSSGNSQVTLNGDDTYVGVGQDRISVTQGADGTITAGAGTSVTENGGTVNFTVPGGGSLVGSTATVSGGAATLANTAQNTLAITTKSGAPSTIALGTGTDNVYSYGGDAIQGGSGSDTIQISAANTLVTGGSGSTVVHNYDYSSDKQTVIGGSGDISYDQGPGSLRFIGGAGTAEINGGFGSLNITAGSGTTTVTGGSGGLVFTAGSGQSSLTLAAGGAQVTFGRGSTSVVETAFGAADVFNIKPGQGGGTDVITGFRGGVDQLNLNGVAVTTLTALRNGYGLTLSDGTSLRMINSTLPPALLHGLMRH